jgi:hypothetical protein
MSDVGSRRISRGFAAATVIGAMLYSPAVAKNPGGGGRAVMNRFAQCTVQRRTELARRFVLNWGVPPSPSDLQEVASSECLRRAGSDVIELNMRDSLYRGALAEQLIRRELAKADVIDPIRLPALQWADPGLPSSVSAADTAVMRLGECVVRADPAGSRAAVLAEQDSSDELARLKAMSPTIARCIAQGETRTFNRTTLRAALAVSYYRLSVAARSAMASREAAQ